MVVATALTLVFVPALYAAWFKVGRAAPATEGEPPVADPVQAT